MSDALWSGRKFRTFSIVNDYNQEALAIEVDLGLPPERMIRVLDRVSEWRGYPEKLRMNNGPELTSVKLAEWPKNMVCNLNSLNQENQLRTTRMLKDSTRHAVRDY